MLWWPFSRRRKRAEKKRAKSLGAATPVRTGRPETPRAVSSPGARTAQVARSLTGAANENQGTTRSSIEKPPLEEPEEQHPAKRMGSREDNVTALPQSPPYQEFQRGPHLRSFDEQRRPISHHQTAPVNTLRHKASSTKKGKRRDKEREEEIRALSSPIPIPGRPEGAPMPTRRASKRRLSLQPRSATEPQGNNSVVSLASPGSVRSGIVGKVSESWHHWDIGTLDMLSPRPKVRYSMTQYATDPMSSLHASRTGSSKDLRKEWGDSRTIDELADDYDISTIRELMDRDARRLEKKKQYQEERARKRLERHAVRKRGENTGEEIADPGEESSRAFEGLGNQGENAGPSSPVEARHNFNKKRDSAQTPTSPKSTENPFRDPESPTASPRAATDAAADKADAVAPVVLPPETSLLKHTEMVPPSERAVSPPVSPFSDDRKSSLVSQSAATGHSLQDLNDTKPGDPSERRASDISARRTGALASLFRRSKRVSGDYTREAPQPDKSFSNASRESMARQPLPAHLIAPPPSAKRRSGTPQRTMSKFREDLPESPASRTQFPSESGLTSPAASETARESKVSDNGRDDSMSSAAAPSAAGLSQSLASVDSEASWLTGPNYPRRRTSQQMVPTTGSVAEGPEEFSASYEDLGQTDEELFRSRVVPRRRAGSNRIEPVMESELSEHDSQADASPDLDENVEFGTAARQPVYVQRHGSARSREGILQQVAGEGNPEVSNTVAGAQEDDFTTGDISPSAEVVRTVSHVRQVSSGSARLLDIPARRDSKRASLTSNPGSITGRGSMSDRGTPTPAPAVAGSLDPAAGAEPGPSEST